MRRICVFIVLTVSAFLGVSTASLAQEATPAPEFPLMPDPALSTVEPRTTDEILAIWFPEGVTPVVDETEQVPEQNSECQPMMRPQPRSSSPCTNSFPAPKLGDSRTRQRFTPMPYSPASAPILWTS